MARGDPGLRKSPPARPPGRRWPSGFRGGAPTLMPNFRRFRPGRGGLPSPSDKCHGGQGAGVCAVLGRGREEVVATALGLAFWASRLHLDSPPALAWLGGCPGPAPPGCGPQRGGQDLEEVLPVSPSLEENLAPLHPVSLPLLL